MCLQSPIVQLKHKNFKVLVSLLDKRAKILNWTLTALHVLTLFVCPHFFSETTQRIMLNIFVSIKNKLSRSILQAITDIKIPLETILENHGPLWPKELVADKWCIRAKCCCSEKNIMDGKTCWWISERWKK